MQISLVTCFSFFLQRLLCSFCIIRSLRMSFSLNHWMPIWMLTKLNANRYFFTNLGDEMNLYFFFSFRCGLFEYIRLIQDWSLFFLTFVIEIIVNLYNFETQYTIPLLFSRNSIFKIEVRNPAIFIEFSKVARICIWFILLLKMSMSRIFIRMKIQFQYLKKSVVMQESNK